MTPLHLILQAEAGAQQQLALTDTLVHMHLKHIYSEYWTCNLVAFLSQEQIVCSVLDEQLQPGFNRYAPYASIVAQDPNAAYVFPLGSAQAVAFAKRVRQTGQQYLSTKTDNYIVYQPLLASS